MTKNKNGWKWLVGMVLFLITSGTGIIWAFATNTSDIKTGVRERKAQVERHDKDIGKIEGALKEESNKREAADKEQTKILNRMDKGVGILLYKAGVPKKDQPK